MQKIVYFVPHIPRKYRTIPLYPVQRVLSLRFSLLSGKKTVASLSNLASCLF